MTQVSDRLASLSPSATLAMSQKSGELKAQGIDVINLSVGEPDFNTPDFIKEAAKKAIDDNFSRYSPVAGYPALRNAIVAKLKNENGLEYTAGQISCANGAKQSVCNTVMVLVNPGDEVIIPAPFWVSYPEMVKLAEGTPVIVPAGIEQDFKITPAQLEAAITPKTKALILCSPSNPTGSVYSAEELAGLAEVLKKHPDIIVIADEIYEHINYIGKHNSIASIEGMKDRTVIVNGVSKAYAMTGWRIGYVLGAPEFVLKEKYDDYAEEITEYASTGSRVLAFGIYDGEVDGKPLTHGILPFGFVLLANPIREAAKETFEYFAEQGVEVKVISGDNPVTVSNVAKQAGIKNADRYVDASEFEDEQSMRKALLNNTVFGRVTPSQKRKFVRILKEAGHTVAMTGDGVNDVLALKDADCSIAMASGSDAAAQASQLVLLESDFSCMPEVVLEGRRVVNNIQRSASLFLVKNIFSFLLSVASVVFMFTYPLEPSQVSLISMFTIGVPAFFLALEPNKNMIKGHFLTNVLLKALPAALTDALAVAALVIFGRTFDVSSTDISTAATMLLAIVGFMILYKISAPMNKIRFSIVSGCIAGLLFCSIFLKDLFAITSMTKECIMLFVVFAIATEPVLRYLTTLVEKVKYYYLKLRGKNLSSDDT